MFAPCVSKQQPIQQEEQQVSIVAQPSIGFLNTKYYSNGSPTEDAEDCLGRITVGLTRSKSLTVLVSPLDMIRLMGMTQVIATIACGIRGLRRGETTWRWPDFDPDPVQENLAQLSRWSLNSAPTWEFPLLAIANQYYDQQADEVKRARYRLRVRPTMAKTGSASKKLKQVYELNTSGSSSKISLSLKLSYVPTLLIAHPFPPTCAYPQDCTKHAPGT